MIANFSLPDLTNTSSACFLQYQAELILDPQGEPGNKFWPLWAEIDEGVAGSNDGSQEMGKQGAFAPLGCTSFTHLATLIRLDTTNFTSFYNGSTYSSLTNENSSYKADAIGLLCRADYFTAITGIKIYVLNSSVISVDTPLQNRTTLMGLNVFDPRSFERNLGGGGSTTEPDKPADFTGGQILTLLPLANQDSLASVAFNTIPDPSPMNASVYTEALSNIYKLTFSLAFPTFMNLSADPSLIQGSSDKELLALVTIDTVSFVCEAILAIAASTSLLLIFIYRKRDKILYKDPDSIAAMCSLVADSFGVSGPLTDARSDTFKYSTKKLVQLTKSSVCHWRKTGSGLRFESLENAREYLTPS